MVHSKREGEGEASVIFIVSCMSSYMVGVFMDDIFYGMPLSCHDKDRERPLVVQFLKKVVVHCRKITHSKLGFVIFYILYPLEKNILYLVCKHVS